jgi:hypothetical protein
MRRSDEPRLPGIIAKGFSNLRDQRGEIDLRDEGGGPEALVQVVFRERTRAALDEDLQQLVSLGRKVELPVGPEQLPRVGVERELPEPNNHCPPIETLENSNRLPKTPQRSTLILRSRCVSTA